MIVLLVACAEPPMLDRVAEAYGDEVVSAAERGVGLFVSAAAVVAEPCGASTLDGYVLSGEGYRAFRVTAPSITIADSGERTYAYGTVAFLGDVGDLTLTSDSNRKQWTARYAGGEGTFTAQYVTVDCVVDEAGLTTSAGVSGSGTYAPDEGEEQSLSIVGGDSAQLAWAPSTAAAPSSGQVIWHVSKDKLEIELEDASTIDPVEYGWPGVAAGSDWSTEIRLTLP